MSRPTNIVPDPDHPLWEGANIGRLITEEERQLLIESNSEPLLGGRLLVSLCEDEDEDEDRS